jgi:hypothetical protein
MTELFREYWWLIFPLMGFAFGGFGMVMGLAMHRDRMRVLRTYAEKGQTPPPELTDPAYDAYGYGRGSYGRPDRYARRAWRREMRMRAWGPFWGVRRSFFFLAIFVAFAMSAWWDGDGHWNRGFVIVAIIAGALFLSSLLAALPMFWDRRGPDGQPSK